MHCLHVFFCSFLGTSLALALLAAGHRVTVLDDLSCGQRKNADMLVAKGARFIEADILTVPEFPRAQEIYHLACPASPPFYQKDPVRTWKISVIGTMRVAEWALEAGRLAGERCVGGCSDPHLQIGARIVFTSTSEVYGDPLEHPRACRVGGSTSGLTRSPPEKESYWGNVNPIGIRSCYDEGKRAAETLLMDMHRAPKPLNVGVARLFNTYGPFMDPKDGRVISNLIIQALKGEPMTVYGTGDQTRSFCYVDDTIAGLMALMARCACCPSGCALTRMFVPARSVAQSILATQWSVPSRMPLLSLPV